MSQAEEIHESLLPFVKDERVLQGSFPLLEGTQRGRITDEKMNYINAYFATRTQKTNRYKTNQNSRSPPKSPFKSTLQNFLPRKHQSDLLLNEQSTEQ